MSPVLHVHNEIRYGGGPAGYLHELRSALADDAPDLSDDGVSIREMPFQADPQQVFGWPARISRKLRKTRILGSWRSSWALEEAYEAMDFDIRRARAWAAAASSDLPRDRPVIVHDIFVAEALAARDPTWAREQLCVITHAPHFYVRQTAGHVLEDSDELPDGARFIDHFIDWEVNVLGALRTTIWPCPEAMDAHRLEIGAAPAERTEYCGTGVARPSSTKSREEMRASWGVQEGQRVVLFLGRPHPHKGFPVFEQLAEDARREGRDDLLFVWGGRNRNQPAASAPRHLGFIADNGAAMMAADLNVVPNTCTYMDIGVLQALSLGAPLLLSRRGGNNAVLARVKGLPGFEPVADALALAAVDQALQAFEDESLPARMVATWREDFSPAAFARNHRDLARRLSA